jgi:hypothetical protein
MSYSNDSSQRNAGNRAMSWATTTSGSRWWSRPTTKRPEQRDVSPKRRRVPAPRRAADPVVAPHRLSKQRGPTRRAQQHGHGCRRSCDLSLVGRAAILLPTNVWSDQPAFNSSIPPPLEIRSLQPAELTKTDVNGLGLRGRFKTEGNARSRSGAGQAPGVSSLTSKSLVRNPSQEDAA